MDEKKHLKIAAVNTAPRPAKAVRPAPEVEPYCPSCGGSTWMWANQGRADYGENGAVQVRICAHCMANGKVTTW